MNRASAGMDLDEKLHLDGVLQITAGQASDAGLKPVNEDCIGLRIPQGLPLTLKGVVAAIADGLSSAEAGREASESCVTGFLSDYFSTPDSWSVKTAAQRVLTAQNRWLYGQSQHGQSQRFLPAHRGCLSTLSILVAKSRTAHVFHVGDTRIYRLRAGTLEQITRDHVLAIAAQKTCLTRAMGMDLGLEIDYRALALDAGDCFLLSSDGVHDFLGAGDLRGALARAAEPERPAAGLEALCRELIAAARAGGSPDNLSCQLLRVDALPPDRAEDLHERLAALPFPPPLAPGMKLDGYRVEEELHASTRSQLYRVVDEASGRRLVMKTPAAGFEDDPAYIERFVLEPWVGRRVQSPHVVEVIACERPQSFLYYLQEYIEGQTLSRWHAARGRPEIREVLGLAAQIASGLRAFHRREILYQDLKPDNVLVDATGRVRLVDFGSCWVGGLHEIAAPLERDRVLGTASHSAPELRWGQSAGIRSEIYAFGTLVYELLTGVLPYGEAIESVRTPCELEKLVYTPAWHHDPMIPAWLDGALRKSVARDPMQRYGELSELLHDLEHPNPLFADGLARPWIERDPLSFWRALAAGLALADVLLLAWWLARA